MTPNFPRAALARKLILSPMMRARQAFAALLAGLLPAVVLVPLVSLVPFSAFAGDPPTAGASPVAGEKRAGEKRAAEKSGEKAEKKYDPLNQTALSLFMETCLQGNAKYVARDLPGAIELYRRAIVLAPRNPLGHYLLGEALLASGSLNDAELSWKTAEEASDDRNPTMRARVLFVLADIKERQKKWDEAKAAWQVYGDYAQKHADAGASTQTSISRGQAIDDMLKQDKLYEVVRQRIAAERDGGAEAPPKK